MTIYSFYAFTSWKGIEVIILNLLEKLMRLDPRKSGYQGENLVFCRYFLQLESSKIINRYVQTKSILLIIQYIWSLWSKNKRWWWISIIVIKASVLIISQGLWSSVLSWMDTSVIDLFISWFIRSIKKNTP